MLPFQDFKKALGEAAHDMTDEQIDELRKLHDQIADSFFEIWLEDKNSKLNIPETL